MRMHGLVLVCDMSQTTLSEAISEAENAELMGRCRRASPFAQSSSVSFIACHCVALLS